jgi:hypothetical protein
MLHSIQRTNRHEGEILNSKEDLAQLTKVIVNELECMEQHEISLTLIRIAFILSKVVKEDQVGIGIYLISQAS